MDTEFTRLRLAAIQMAYIQQVGILFNQLVSSTITGTGPVGASAWSHFLTGIGVVDRCFLDVVQVMGLK